MKNYCNALKNWKTNNCSPFRSGRAGQPGHEGSTIELVEKPDEVKNTFLNFVPVVVAITLVSKLKTLLLSE
jgi:hypothetical protein